MVVSKVSLVQHKRRVDPVLVGVALGLSCLGMVAIYSATRAEGGGFARRQALWVAIGVCLLMTLSRVDYRLLLRASRSLYLANLGLLVAVLLFSKPVMGAQRWLNVAGFTLQPSEVAKLITIVTLSAHVHAHRASVHTLWGVVRALFHILPPMVLVLKQPDLGTSLVILAIWFGVLWVAGAQARHLALVALCGLLAFVGTWHLGLIKDYQKQRLISFLNPSADRQGSGWHIIQSKIAIGSGGLLGKGLFRGSQSQGGFIPEQHTDFINTVIGEEMGFVGSLLVLALFFTLIYRALQIAAECDDLQGRWIAVGIACLFTFHVFVNLGMTIHIMPVTGVPLPFLSYGGSSMLVNMACVAVLLNIHRQRENLRF